MITSKLPDHFFKVASLSLVSTRHKFNDVLRTFERERNLLDIEISLHERTGRKEKVRGRIFRCRGRNRIDKELILEDTCEEHNTETV